MDAPAFRCSGFFMDEAIMKIKGLSQLISQLGTSDSKQTQIEASKNTSAPQQEAVSYQAQRTPKEQERIDTLKSQVASKSYNVDSRKVAQAFVDFYKK